MIVSMFTGWFGSILLLVKLCCHVGLGYNVDTEFPQIFRGPSGSRFGVTAEIVKTVSNAWILVGATGDNFTDKPEIPEPGNVYACPVNFNVDAKCSILPNLRTAESTSTVKPSGVFEQRQQLLGATIHVPKNRDSPILICAPKWRNLRFFSSNSELKSYQVVGNCFKLPNRNDLNQTTLNMFRMNMTMIRDYYRDPMFGFSLTDSPHPSFDVIFSTPNAGLASTGGTFAQAHNPTRTQPFIIENSELITTYVSGSYFAYSLATGQFGSSGYYYVAGAPGFSNLNGVVGSFSILEVNGVSEQQVKLIEGLQIGGGFGQTLVIADVNADGHDDILVGAPNTYLDDVNKNRVIYDVGAIHVFYGNGDPATLINQDPHTIMGTRKLGSRFGTAISGVGDLNKDGINDIAVGAPYEEGTGVVYIYNGNKPRMEDRYSQRILGKEIRVGVSGFGYYISKFGEDLDENKYNDFAVGAYKSDEVVLLRARPIVEVRVYSRIDPDPVPLTSTGTPCGSQGSQGSTNPCFTASLCFDFTGEGTNKTYIDVEIFADTERGRPRVSFDGAGQQDSFNVSLFEIYSYRVRCLNVTLRTLVVDRQFFELIEIPVVLKTTFRLSTESVPSTVRAILNRNVPTMLKSQVSFDTGCKSLTCFSNLQLVSLMDKTTFMIGQDKDLSLNIVLKNFGEPSFMTELKIIYPSIFSYSGVRTELFSEKITCNPVPTSGNTAVLSCRLDTPFYAHMVVNVTIYFYLTDAIITNPDILSSSGLTFSSSVSTNHDTEPTDNTDTKTVQLAMLTDVSLKIASSAEQILATNNTVSFTTSYTLYNDGPCQIEAALIYFSFPVLYEEKVWIDEDNSMPTPSNIGDKCILKYHPEQVNVASGNSPASFTFTVSRKFVQRPIAQKPETSQTMFCDDLGSGYDCAVVECTMYDIKPTETDKRTFSLAFELETDLLPPLQKGKAFLTFVTQAAVYPTSSNKIPLYFINNVTGEVSVDILLSELFSPPAEEVEVWVIIVACLLSILLFIVVIVVLWKCGFFERKKRKELNAFKRKTQMSIRSARSGGAGSVKSRRSNTAGSFRVKKMGDDHVKLHDKKVEDNTDNSTMESATECK